MKDRIAGLMGLAKGCGLLTVSSCLVFSTAFPARAQTTRIQQSEHILQPAAERVEHDSFGSAVAIVGKTMVVGAINADGNEVGAGAAYIFDKIGNDWVQTAKLFAADGRAEREPSPPFPPDEFRSDSFGLTVAISSDGNTVAVGAPAHNHTGMLSNTGAVYVFERSKGVWSQQAELLSPTPNDMDHFGDAPDFGGIGISGNTIVVTDQGNGRGLGAIDVFTRTNDAWSFTTQLFVPNDPFFFPSSLAFDGRTLAVGSDSSDAPTAGFAGVVYVFQFSEGQWSAPVTLSGADATSGGTFGYSVSVSGNTIAVGAAFGPGATAQSGAAYVFAGEDGLWTQIAKLNAADGVDGDDFGFSVVVSGQTVFVGAVNHTPPATGAFAAGAAYVYQPRDDNWSQIAELSATDGISGGSYGTSVALLNNTLVVGAPGQHPPVEGYPGGEGYLYSLRP